MRPWFAPSHLPRRRLQGEHQLPKVVQGVTFRDGVEVAETPAQTAA